MINTYSVLMLGNFLLYFLIAYLTVRITTPYCAQLAVLVGIVDAPDGKLKCHQKVTPYLGGIAFLSGIVAGMLCSPYLAQMPLFLCGMTVLLITGLYDDKFVLSPSCKLIGQLTGALLLGGHSTALAEAARDLLLQLYVPAVIAPVLGNICVVLWILIIINAFNLVDVMDGLATILGYLSAIGLAILSHVASQPYLTSLSLCCAGALLGFLYFNRPVATIYLGDAGSMVLGGILAYIASHISWDQLQLGMPRYNAAFYALYLIFFIPLLELCMLIGIRSWHGIPFFRGSKHHFVHYMKKNGFDIFFILKSIILIGLFLLLILVQLLCRVLEPEILLVLGSLVTAAWIAMVYFLTHSFLKNFGSTARVALNKVFYQKQQEK